jgi:hypothetical protein
MKRVILILSGLMITGCAKEQEDCSKWREAYSRERSVIERCADIPNCRVDMDTIRWETAYRVRLMTCLAENKHD